MHVRSSALATLALTSILAAGSARAQCFTEFRVSPSTYPSGIASGPDGNVWFTEFGVGSVGDIMPAAPNAFSEFNVSTGDIRPAGIAAGPDGNLWFVEITGNKIGRILPMSPNTITEFPLPTANAKPQDIVAAPDGKLWFTEGIGKVGFIDPNSPNAITEIAVPSGQGAGGIAVGPDGNVWFAETFVSGNDNGDKVARVGLPSHVITEFTIPTANCAPGDITSGPDGNLWFTEINGNKVGRITPGAPNTITEFPVITANSRPDRIVAGPDGNLWFSETGGAGAIGRISPTSPNALTEFSISSGDIANGPDGNVWFTALNQSVWRLSTTDCDKCAKAKLRAIAKKEEGRLKCLAKVAKTGDSSTLADCVAKLDAQYAAAFTKAGECGSPATACANRVDYCVNSVVANLPDLNACEAAKLKAAGKLASDLLKCAAKSASSGKPLNPDCALGLPGNKLGDKLVAAFAKADAASGPCSGDAFTTSVGVELGCHVQIPIADSAGTVTGLVCTF